MRGRGFFNENHTLGLGDVMVLSDDENTGDGGGANEDDPLTKSKPVKGVLPSIEGKETCAEIQEGAPQPLPGVQRDQ